MKYRKWPNYRKKGKIKKNVLKKIICFIIKIQL